MKELLFSASSDTYFPLGFPISRKAREWYRLSDLLAESGDKGLQPLVYVLRGVADRINAGRDSWTYLTPPLHAGQLFVAGLLAEIVRYLADRYCLEEQPGCFATGLAAVQARVGAGVVERPFRSFVVFYPPHAVCLGRETEAEYLNDASHQELHRYAVAREMVLLNMAMDNRALEPFRTLHNDEDLRRESPYELFVDGLEAFFKTQPPFPGSDQTLFEFLRAPMRACPDSLEGQLEYIRLKWAHLLPAEFLERILLAEGLIKEESQMRGHGPGPAQVLHFDQAYLLDHGYPEPVCFTHDRDWMSNVVLIAKSIYVWLDQLSKKHGRAITRLDQIPNEELDRLARWGFTGLWLIGVWERSPASQRIKQIMGNPEALASAYSVYDYVIAEDLGGAAGFDDLRARAAARGIRLASDMVPNHMGLYSRWVIEHPGWFMQTDYPPFPSYRFGGENLSRDDRVGLHIEDGYWEHRDAAVVFKRVDHWTGETHYIYHGNDGTNMPWNDTAQLNFLLPEVREAVVQLILHVARKFPIIRFDAAMTLAKKHYQRLWFPKPGDAGAVPSRAERGMSREEFDAAFPKEFWREVVDRIQAEVPDTLLLAEAFWLMEGYFVRTLGMHRVYNSAFMNMLKMEENSKYRLTVRNVLEFSPEVAQRFVNFMNNPDEETAIEQFGRDDKYFGVALLMVTMPGLPMFGHGQIEGLSEKYGMEYRRAYWDEPVNEDMVRRHEAEIFPLMRKRQLFSGAEHFAFYDFCAPEGWVDENVFAYSNRAGTERALILYNNAYSTTRGTIHTSTAINIGEAENPEAVDAASSKNLCRRTLTEALALDTREDCYYVFRDYKTGLEYLRQAARLEREGLTVELHAYQYHAFLDFREIHDADGTWNRLAASIGDSGVPSVDTAYKEMFLGPILDPFRKAISADMLRAIEGQGPEKERKRCEEAIAEFFCAAVQQTSLAADPDALTAETLREFDALRGFKAHVKKMRPAKAMAHYLLDPMPEQDAKGLDFWRIPFALALSHPIDRTRRATDYSARLASVMDEWLLGKVIAETFEQFDDGPDTARMDALLASILANYPAAVDFAPESGGALVFRKILDDPAVQEYLRMNRYEGVVWINKEQMERMCYWLFFESLVTTMTSSTSQAGDAPAGLTKQVLVTHFENTQALLNAAQEANYQAEAFLQQLAPHAT